MPHFSYFKSCCLSMPRRAAWSTQETFESLWTEKDFWQESESEKSVWISSLASKYSVCAVPNNVIVVTDCPCVEAMGGEVKVMVTEDAATRKAFSFDSTSGIKFPFGLCEVDGEVHFSDHLRHSINKINFSEQSVSLALGIEDDPRQNDGPSESANLCYPAGLAARGACLYIAEHPSEI